MSVVNYSPLRSNAGFQSPGFSVDADGKISTDENLYIKGLPLFEEDDSSISLSTDIQQSSLRTLGELFFLDVKGDFNILDSNRVSNISVVDGRVVIVNTDSETPGSIDGVQIGFTTPEDAKFADLTVNGTATIATANITTGVIAAGTVTALSSVTGNIDTVNTTTGNITTLNSTTVNSTTLNTDDINVDDISISNQPTQADHATRKDYVDNRISALSIALGA